MITIGWSHLQSASNKPYDAIDLVRYWLLGDGLLLDQLMASSHYLKLWMNINIKGVRQHSHKGKFAGNAKDICPWYEFENYQLKIPVITFPRGQWANSLDSYREVVVTWQEWKGTRIIMVSKIDHHWFRNWLVTWSMPSHFLNQCWFNC